MISHLVAAGKFVSRIKTRGRMSIRLRGRFLKILFLGEARKVVNEAVAREAVRAAPWQCADSITNDVVLATRYCGIVTARLTSGSRPTLEQCIAISRDVMHSIPESRERKGVLEVVDGRLVELLDRIDPTLKAHVQAAFRDVALPVTGAHGDLGCRNVLVDDDGRYKIIDWECFRENGSCIEDLCRLLGTAIRSSSSDAGSDVREIRQSGIMDVIAQGGYLTHHQCLLLYSLSQASCELEKKDEADVARRMAQRLRQVLAGSAEALPSQMEMKGIVAL